MKRTLTIAAALVLLVIPVIALRPWAGAIYIPGHSVLEGELPDAVESHISANFPARETLTGWSLAIRVLGGQREYNQIFISGDELIPVLDPPLDYLVSDNTQAILEFAQQTRPHVYFMIIPTVSAIRQQGLPSFFLGQNVNQPQFIYQVYAQMQMPETLTTIDVYRSLSDAREQYIFYRTHGNLTSLGGFYIYDALGSDSRLLEGIRPSLQHYDIEHVMYGFFGDLYARSPFQNTRGDILSIFHYRRAVPSREYIVTAHRNGHIRTYHTLFPLHHLDLEGREMDIFLGGLGSKTVITTSPPSNLNLLVVGDHTALAFVPFLASHYRSITLLDLSQMGEDEFHAVAENIGRDFYDHILIAYSIETYMHHPHPARVLELLPLPGDYQEYWY